MTQHKFAHLFIAKANQDIVVFEKWRLDPQIPQEIVGFHAQQAAEKMLKAVLTFRYIEFPFTHRLSELIDLCRDNNILIPDKFDRIRFLTPFAVEFRYNLYQEEEDIIDLKEFYFLLLEFRDWVYRFCEYDTD